jgi:hypothetical protein
MATKKFRKEVRAKVVGFIAAAFGLVVGLAWNDAVVSLIEAVFPIEKNTVIAKFGYATLLSVILVTIIILLMKFAEEKES